MLKISKKQREEAEKREKIFNQSSPAQQRILVAKDVIDRLKLAKLKPGSTFGIFEDKDIIKSPSRVPLEKRDKFMKSQVRDVVGMDPECSACGVGALFISSFLYADKLQVGDLSVGLSGFYYREIQWYLDKRLNLFSPTQLKLIEVAYERGGGNFTFQDDPEDEETYGDDFEDLRRAYYFGHEHYNDYDRLVAIMENIIENDGTFIP